MKNYKSKIMIKIKKYYKIISPIFSIFMSSAGLALSFIGFKYDPNNENFIFIILLLAEFFLVLSTIYSIFSVFRSLINKSDADTKNIQILKYKSANKTIFENNKAIITTYKDFNDKLNIIKDNYVNTNQLLKEHYNKLLNSDCSDDIEEYIEIEKKRVHENLKNDLISNYNRFLSSTTNLLRQSMQEYLATKDYSASVSIAIKQLDKPTNYSSIDKENISVFTTFRDSKTYSSKQRNETWEKEFKISKNSDFMISIEKDYYIFNFMDRNYLEDGLYQNENSAFYENYNSGVTCTINSCINGKRKLFGYLACDSLITCKDNEAKVNAYDWEAANIMMFTANIIGMYLENFLKIWKNNYENYQEDLENWKNSNLN